MVSDYLTKYILDICLLIDLVSNYTREAGVRELERKFGALCRAVAVRVAEKEKGSNGTESSTVSIPFLNRSSRRKRGMASNPLFIIPDFFCIFQTNLAMAQSQFSNAKLRQPTGQTFFPTFPKEFSHFLQN